MFTSLPDAKKISLKHLPLKFVPTGHFLPKSEVFCSIPIGSYVPSFIFPLRLIRQNKKGLENVGSQKYAPRA
jgi:hypothetical protein